MEYYASLCRLCETTDMLDDKWSNLCSSENDHLIMKLRACTNVEISMDDKLPKRICSRCQASLDQAYNFKQQCEIANAKLQHEIGFLEQNDWDRSLMISTLYNPYVTVKQEQNYEENNLENEPILIKTEPGAPEGEEESQHKAYFAGPEEPEIDFPIPAIQLKVGAYEIDTAIECEESPEESTSESDSESGNNGAEAKVQTPKIRKSNYKAGNCAICGERFPSEKKLVLHSIQAHGKTPFDCKICNKNFKEKSHLTNHEMLHSGVRQFECTQCDKKYANQRGLQSHINDQHNENQLHVCDQCGQKFTQASKLQNHYVIHIEERNFICHICSKGFKSQNHLGKHMNRHLPEGEKVKRKPRNKTYVCPHCGKIMKHPDVLKNHIRTHTGEQPFECSFCPKRFATAALQRKHVLTHTGERPYVCEYCQKAFRQRHHMMTHIKGVHPNDKPYQCKLCPEAFATLGSLQYHERRVHQYSDSGATTSVPAPMMGSTALFTP